MSTVICIFLIEVLHWPLKSKVVHNSVKYVCPYEMCKAYNNHTLLKLSPLEIQPRFLCERRCLQIQRNRSWVYFIISVVLYPTASSSCIIWLSARYCSIIYTILLCCVDDVLFFLLLQEILHVWFIHGWFFERAKICWETCRFSLKRPESILSSFAVRRPRITIQESYQ